MSLRDHVLTILRQRADELRARGVLHASLFGSVARGEETPESDVDIMVVLDPEANIDLIEYSGIALDLEDWVGRKVDVANRDRLKQYVRPNALRDEISAF